MDAEQGRGGSARSKFEDRTVRVVPRPFASPRRQDWQQKRVPVTSCRYLFRPRLVTEVADQGQVGCAGGVVLGEANGDDLAVGLDEGRKASLWPCEVVVMAAGVTAASGRPAGLNSAWAGSTKMFPAASRPSVVMFPMVTVDRTRPPLPKL